MEILDSPNSPSDSFNEQTPFLQIVIMILTIIFLSLIGTGLIFWLCNGKGIEVGNVMDILTSESDASDRNFIRSILIINHLTTFVFPGIIAAIIVYKNKWLSGLSLNNIPRFDNATLGSLLIVCAFPLVQFTFWLNKQLPLPEWMVDIEDNTSELIMNLLATDAPYELYFNIFVIAIIPAIGEEIIFRGILQKNISRIFNNPHIGIWVAAIIFSAIHFQFQGFIPRMLLGALLGYLFYWTGNLWIPIIAHLVNNGFQVVAQYLYKEDMSNMDIEAMDTLPPAVTITSLILVSTISYFIIKNNRKIMA